MTPKPSTTDQSGDELLSLADAALILGMPRRTLTRRLATGQIAGTKIGHARTSSYAIARAEIDRVLAGVGVAPAGGRELESESA